MGVVGDGITDRTGSMALTAIDIEDVAGDE
jgi:hypothetical protein